MTKKPKTLEQLLARRQQLEGQLFNEKIRLHRMIEDLGWGAGMRRTKITPSFRKEDAIIERLDVVNAQIAELSK